MTIERADSLTFIEARESFLGKYQINDNYLQENKFVFVCHTTPYLNFFSQTVNVPGVTGGVTMQPTSVNPIPRMSQNIDYNTLDIEFIVDEDLRIYEETYQWILGLQNPESTQQQAEQKKKGLYTDIHLLTNTNSETDNLSIVFIEAFPVSLTGLNLSSTSSETLLKAQVSFGYERYEIRR